MWQRSFADQPDFWYISRLKLSTFGRLHNDTFLHFTELLGNFTTVPRPCSSIIAGFSTGKEKNQKKIKKDRKWRKRRKIRGGKERKRKVRSMLPISAECTITADWNLRVDSSTPAE